MFDCLCSSLPKETRVLKVGGGLKVETIPLPTSINDKEVLLKVTNASLNIRDGIKLDSPEKRALASDFAGVVKRAGSDSGFKKGELVYGTIEEGAFSEYLVVSNESIARIPNNISSDVASCLPFAGWVAYQIFEKKKREYANIAQNNPLLKVIVDTIRKNQAQSTVIVYDDDTRSDEENKEELGDGKSGGNTSQNIVPMVEMSELAEKLQYAKNKGTFAKISKWIADNRMWFKEIVLPKELMVLSPEKLRAVKKEFTKRIKAGPYVVPIDGELFTKFEAYMIFEKKGFMKEHAHVEAMEDLDITKNYLSGGGKRNLNATQYSILSSASHNTSHLKRSANYGRVMGPRNASFHKDDSSLSFRMDAQ